MSRYRNFLYLAIGIPLFIIFTWLFALPEDLIKATIEDSIAIHSGQNINASIEGLRKGLFFTIYADSLELKIDNTPALRITDISSKINPFHLIKKEFTFSIKGYLGTGTIKGFFKLPGNGILKIDGVDINSIPYLASAGLEGSGLISAKLNFINNAVDIIFKIPDADIRGSVKGMPLSLNSFRKIQGALNLREKTIKVTSISLEGNRGYARLKGDVTNGFMNLILELMPSAGELEPIESMLISKYQISPGYYVIPIEGPLL